MEHHLKVEKTARYFTSGNPEKAKFLLIALHGYGQLAQFFIRKLDCINEDYFIVTPEGLHRFYLNGSSGRVGASWMTKEDRLSDIQDNTNWLNQILNELHQKYEFEKTIVLGFSQGGATAARWINESKHRIDHFISWASVYPPDLLIEENSKLKENYFVLGNQDEYFDETSSSETIYFYKSIGFKTITFDGNHSIDKDVLNQILNQLYINKSIE
jgi:predicted esterase